ncbi:MAG: proline--tRNA ligase [Atopococcus tabaci]|uniref:Proline--tRNA ligase n=1 Tax=Atopococcus tabaci TaxID=269774 RepID=A0AA43RJP7_9LACT|nr:proline--tRNA ligase [Atopococcus tabaci]
MLQSKVFIPTLKETPNDAEIISHQLLLRAGYVRQVTSGVYTYLPLGHRVIQKIEKIIREEHEKYDVVELMMPILLPADLWKRSGRYDTYGPELFRLNDRHERDSILGPTHEETFTEILKGEVKSYKRLPLHLYQIQTKFRDEKRPRFGLLRTREFIMKDAYSFDVDQAGLDASYQMYDEMYAEIFDRMGLNYRGIIGDGGAMGGSDSKEYMAVAETGEDTIVYSDESDYAANLEMAAAYFDKKENDEELKALELVETPDVKTMEDLSSFLDVSLDQTLKSLLFIADEKPVLVVVRGDHDVNEVKLTNYLSADSLELASDIETEEYTGSTPGSVGPVQLKSDVRIVADRHVELMKNVVVGANQEGHHYINANLNRDMPAMEFEDLRLVQEGERSPDGKGRLKFAKGIEIGHIFKLGTRYSESLGLEVIDNTGKSNPVVMGSYGIGVSRVMAAIAEQYADESGLVWPKEITPYHVHLIPVSMKDETQQALAQEIYTLLEDAGFEVLVDDRDERAGVKFADSDLIGLPVRIIVGKKAGEGIIEFINRQTKEKIEIPTSEILENVKKLLEV